jgi:hypothetical protein
MSNKSVSKTADDAAALPLNLTIYDLPNIVHRQMQMQMQG